MDLGFEHTIYKNSKVTIVNEKHSIKKGNKHMNIFSISSERAMQIIKEFQDGNTDNWEEYDKAVRWNARETAYSRGYRFLTAMWSLEDYISEVSLVAYTDCSSYNPEYSFSTWIGKLCKETYKKVKKENNRAKINIAALDSLDEESESIVELLASDTDVESEVLLQDLRHIIMEFTEDMRPEYRDAIRLCVLNEQKPAVAAEIMGVNRDTFYRYLNRAKNRLVDYLREQGFGEDCNKQFTLEK